MTLSIEIADDRLSRAQKQADEKNTTLTALVEKGLRLVLAANLHGDDKSLSPLVTWCGGGLTDEFKKADWNHIRDESYRS